MSFLARAARHYKAEPHQKAAWDELETRLSKDTLSWFQAAYSPSEEPLTANPGSVSSSVSCPYFKQNDNASGQGFRECFSSSCGMIAAFYGKVKTDDEYNSIRKKYGDTTSLTAQLNALTSLGLRPAFSTKGRPEDLIEEIKAGRPVAVGWLHHGPVSKPSGGGHWSVVVGYTPTHFIIHDPNGEADLLNGGYVNQTNGKAQSYSRKNWLPRWCVEGSGSGWLLTCKP